jgi:hypothetical protein
MAHQSDAFGGRMIEYRVAIPDVGGWHFDINFSFDLILPITIDKFA